MNDSVSLGSYKQEWVKFSKEHAKAKDFVKFLTTLER